MSTYPAVRSPHHNGQHGRLCWNPHRAAEMQPGRPPGPVRGHGQVHSGLRGDAWGWHGARQPLPGPESARPAGPDRAAGPSWVRDRERCPCSEGTGSACSGWGRACFLSTTRAETAEATQESLPVAHTVRGGRTRDVGSPCTGAAPRAQDTVGGAMGLLSTGAPDCSFQHQGREGGGVTGTPHR